MLSFANPLVEMHMKKGKHYRTIIGPWRCIHQVYFRHILGPLYITSKNTIIPASCRLILFQT